MPTSYIRFTQGTERRTERGRFPGLHYEHPLIGGSCAECEKPFHAGDLVSLFAVGPATRDAAVREQAGRWYTALAVAMHETCAWEEQKLDDDRQLADRGSGAG